MTARVPAPDFRHLSVWPARGARYGDGDFSFARRSFSGEAASPRSEGQPACMAGASWPDRHEGPGAETAR